MESPERSECISAPVDQVSRMASTQVTVEAVGILGNKWGGGKENQPNQSYIPKSYGEAQFDACHPSVQCGKLTMYYRHQADVCHAYQILRRNGVKEENIIVFMYDDIADNWENPWKGQIINSPDGEDVYHGVPKTWKSLPDSHEVSKDLPNAIITNIDAILERLLKINLFFIARRIQKDTNQEVLYLSGKVPPYVPFLVELTTVVGYPSLKCVVKTPSPEMAPLFFEAIETMLR